MAVMGTVVSIEVDAPETAVTRAFEWFHQVEAVCSRFDQESELRQLPVGVPTRASSILFEAVRFALLLAV
jgi:thiamine biosynthesis lipoprotein